MTFEKLIVTHSENLLTDGTLTCSYQQIPMLFESIDQWFSQRKIPTASCLALEGINSVPTALMLAYLLSKNYSFMLLPPHPNPALPKFCRYQLIIQPSQQVIKPEKYVSTLLNIKENNQYLGQFTGSGKLYLRTSGSMGDSKIVVHSHSQLLGNVLNCVNRFQLENHDRIVIPVPIFHMYGLGAAFLPALIVGASLDLQHKSNILKYLERERQFKPNIAFLIPTLCEMLVTGRTSSRPYKLVVTAGEKIKKELFFALAASCGNLVSLYGSTEMGATAAALVTDPLELRATTVGKPMEGVQLRIEEPDLTEAGKLYCQHQYGFESYVNDEGKILGKAPDWYETGDLAKIYPNGYLQILERSDNKVNRSGHLVLLSDIETAISKIDQVDQVIVLASPEENLRGRRIIAFCVSNLSGTQIREACFKHLPNYAVPDQVEVVKSLPTLPSGKIDRQTLNKMISPK